MVIGRATDTRPADAAALVDRPPRPHPVELPALRCITGTMLDQLRGQFHPPDQGIRLFCTSGQLPRVRRRRAKPIRPVLGHLDYLRVARQRNRVPHPGCPSISCVWALHLEETYCGVPQRL